MDDLSHDAVAKLVFSDLAAVTMVPQRLTDIASWHEHIPFASWLIRQIRPLRFVELGVHKGDSYSAFCQAIAEARLPTVCFGIDTWQGEQHAGTYDDSVWQEFSEYHSQHYATFSRLIRSTFDDALPYFEDGSIDLLHIDGRHFYDDVKHDFESWLPKLSPSAVVLFHDINVRERDFGVWRIWDEVCAQYPARSLSFAHGHGLGVLFTGSTPPPLREKLCALNAAELLYVRNAFAALGKSAARQAQVAYGLRQIESLRAQAREVDTLKAKLVDSDADADATQAKLRSAEQVATIHRLSSQLKTLEAERDTTIYALSNQLKTLEAERDATIGELSDQMKTLEVACELLRKERQEVLASTRWKITEPLAHIVRMFRGPKG